MTQTTNLPHPGRQGRDTERTAVHADGAGAEPA